MGAVLSFFRPAPVARGDWSQQELAEFYRVEAALSQSGLRVTSDRGLSDEDDPWFVFCRFDGEVILHFARIDGQYVVASEAFEHALKGPDFRALLNAVAAEHPTLVPLPRPDANGRRGNLIMHPAALLAAIVASVAFQLAGGDAVAGELASDAPAIPMQSAADAASAGGAFRLVTDVEADRNDAARPNSGEEERHAQKQVLVLSVVALISTTLPTDEETASADVGPTEHQFALHRDQSVPIPVVQTVAATEEGRARGQALDGATAELTVTPTTSGYLVFNAPGQFQARTAQASSGAVGFDFGLPGNHDHLEFHLPVSAVLVSLPQGLPAAARLLSIAAATEKTASAPEPQASSAARETSAATPSEHAAEPAGTEIASGGKKTSIEGGSEGTNSNFSPSTHGAASSANLSSSVVVQGSSSLTSSGQGSGTGASTTIEKVVGFAASMAGSTASSSTGAASNSGNLTSSSIRAALGAFIEQHSGSADASGLINLAAVDLSSKVKLTDLSLVSSLKGIGGKLVTDILSGVADGTTSTTKIGSSGPTVEATFGKVGLADQGGVALATPAEAPSVGSVAFSKAKAPAVPDAVDAAAAIETPGGATLNTVALSLPAVVIRPKTLDDAGRELITRFREATPQMQTFVTDHSFVMIDMDTANYAHKDFSIRTWSIGPDHEITIVGIAPEVVHPL